MSRRIIVVGGGIAGLAAVHRLLELRNDQDLDLDVLLLEASHRLGGSIATERIDGFVIEAGPDSFISEKPWALRLCERLGLGPRLVSTQAAHQKIYIVHNGKLVPLPEGFFLLAPTQLAPFVQTPLFSWRGKLRMAAELLMPRGNGNIDESLGAFVRRRFGSEALERIAQPLLGGIYAADPDKLSLIATMPRSKRWKNLNAASFGRCGRNSGAVRASARAAAARVGAYSLLLPAACRSWSMRSLNVCRKQARA
jgi:protoporphyrinogen/coproporphyrinogen III oxidase